MRRVSVSDKAALWAGVLLLPFLPLFLMSQDAHARLTATQSVEVEYRTDIGDLAVYSALVIDLAAAPRWHLTYVHDRGWRALERWQRHDLSVTHYLRDNGSFTIGWRRKIPEEPVGEAEDAIYGILAWQWGGS